MLSDDSIHYKISLPLKPGTTIKYRYSRQNDLIHEEYTTGGTGVRYRLYEVEPSGIVNDIVARWDDTIYSGDMGRAYGKVLDSVTNKPIPGLLVTCGGASTITDAFGKFIFNGLPPGIHLLNIYSKDGTYETFQQGVEIAVNAATPIDVNLHERPLIDVTFLVKVPTSTLPGIPLRFAGNLLQLGNSYADLSGGMSSHYQNMPLLSSLPDGSYGVILSLPAGAHIRYKYTLGDGFWNAESTELGTFVLREFVVPEESTTINDTITAWGAEDSFPITFDVTVPANTPDTDTISIQFDPYGWTNPIPMWPLEERRWVYVLSSPLTLMNQLSYRYCRSDQCSVADNLQPEGDFASGNTVHVSDHAQVIENVVNEWIWWNVDTEDISAELPETIEKTGEFIKGIELQTGYHPSFNTRYAQTHEDILRTSADWIVLTPSLSVTRITPPTIQSVSGINQSWRDLIIQIQEAQEIGLKVAIRPVLQFDTSPAEFWLQAPRDFSWWVSFYDQLEAFFLNYAKIANDNHVEILVLGEDALSQSYSSSTLPDGSASGIPADAPERWESIISVIKEQYPGRIGWYANVTDEKEDLPDFVNSLDLLFLQWNDPFFGVGQDGEENRSEYLEAKLQEEIYPVWLAWRLNQTELIEEDTVSDYLEKPPIVLMTSIPSVEGVIEGCIPGPMEDCINPSILNFPAPALQQNELSFTDQAIVYNEIFNAIVDKEWIGGLIAMGYYPPTYLLDKSTSIHGKPAEEIIRNWFELIAITPE